MSIKFITRVLVKPAPTTLVETSAVLRRLKSYGLVESFVQEKLAKPLSVNDGACYRVEFKQRPSALDTEFDVPVYHNVLSVQDEDPFNLRGIKNRKPPAKPTTFHCACGPISTHPLTESRQADGVNPYRGQYVLNTSSLPRDLCEIYGLAGAPYGLARAFTHFPPDNSFDAPPTVQHEQATSPNGIKMDALMVSWKEARGKTGDEET